MRTKRSTLPVMFEGKISVSDELVIKVKNIRKTRKSEIQKNGEDLENNKTCVREKYCTRFRDIRKEQPPQE